MRNKDNTALAKAYTLLYIIAIVAVTATTACSCDNKCIYDHYEHLPLSGWERNDTIYFGIPCRENGTYSLEIGLRANQAFPYQSISMIMECTSYPSKTTKRDTLQCRIIDKRGRLTGKRGISYSEVSYKIADISLQRHDSLSIKISHCMSKEIIPGLSDIGIKAEKL